MAVRFSAPTKDAAPGVAEVIPDLIQPEIVASAFEQSTFMPLLRRIDFTGPGANFTIPQIGTAMAFGALTHGTAPVEKVFDTAGRTNTPVERILDVVVPRKVLQDSGVSLQDEIIKEVGVLLADDIDSLAAATHAESPTSSPDHLIGANAVEMAFSDLRDGMKLLYIQKAPRPFAWVIHPIQWAELLKDDIMVNAAAKGSPVLTEGLGPNGFATKVLDVEIYVAEQIVEDTGLKSLMFTKNAALVYGFKMQTSPINGSTSEVSVEVDYNAALRAFEINTTYESHIEGGKGVSTTTNTWMVTILS